MPSVFNARNEAKSDSRGAAEKNDLKREVHFLRASSSPREIFTESNVRGTLKSAALLLSSWVVLAAGCLVAAEANQATAIPPDDAAGGGWADGGPQGSYFTNSTFAGEPAFTRRDVRVAFDWEKKRPVGGSPAEPFRSFPNQGFSIRWVGRVIPRFSEAYTFTLRATGDAQLKVKPAGATDPVVAVPSVKKDGVASSAPLQLEAGKPCDVTLEYDNAKSPAAVELRWSCPSAPEQVIDPVVAQGLNAATWAGYCWANEIKRTRYVTDDKKPVPVDDQGWPKADCSLLCNEGLTGCEGVYQLSFQGKAEVTLWPGESLLTAGGQTFKNKLPRGTGYDPASNQTLITFEIKQPQGILRVALSKTARDGGEAKGDGVTGIWLMRPVSLGAPACHHSDEIIFRPFKAVVTPYTCLRWLQIANVDCDGTWASRTTPGWQASTRRGPGPKQSGGECWEMLITLANECGKDLYICLPMQADNTYFEKFARLIRYGSDGVEPYDREVDHPRWPPLNPNLRLYVEVGNEIWNWGFASTHSCADQATQEVKDKTPDGALIDYDGKGNYRRWHALRTVRASDAFRRVLGDAAMGARVRLLMEYQYDNYQSTAWESLNFMDAWFNNGDGDHVKAPHPIRHWIWGGGGATYYGVGNADGHQDAVKLPDPGFEAGTVPDGQESAAPAGSGWTCTGPAAIYRNYWTSVADFTPGTPGRLKQPSAVGCTLRVDKPLFLRSIGCWLRRGAGTYTLTLLGPQGVMAQSSVAPQHYKMSEVDGWCWGAVSNALPQLVPGADYHLLAMAEKGAPNLYTEPVTVEAGPGFQITGATRATSKPNTDPTNWKIENVKPGAFSFGPVAVQATTGDGARTNALPDPFMGGQGGVVRTGGSLSTTINFPKAGRYALELHASGSETEFLPFGITVGGHSANPTRQNDARVAETNGNFAIGGFERRTGKTAEVWGSAVFSVDKPGDTELRITGDAKRKDRWTVFDQIHVASVDALMDSGFGAGQAFGQVAQNNYTKQLNNQAIYARSFGMPVIAYEAGWSLGGDFDAKPIHTWCKFMEDRATGINDTAEDIFLRAGSFMSVWGVYTYWPEYDIANAASYPLMRSVAGIASRLPPEADNGLALPCQLSATNRVWGWNKPAFTTRGQWQSWLVLAPASGTWNFTVQAKGTAAWDLEVDSVRVGGGAQGDSTSASPCSVRLVKGQHGVRFRAGGPLTLDSITATSTQK